jgi:shikimate dehydrogenase
MRLAVLGDPLTFTLSPELHRAGLESLGIACESQAIRTPPELLGERLSDLAGRGFRGVNLTAPLKEHAIPHLARISDSAARARSVNKVGFDADGWWGDTTDGPGFVDLLRALGRRPEEERALMLGAGGAARSLALALVELGGEVVVSARRPDAAAAAWEGIPDVRFEGWNGDGAERALAAASLIVNATPVADDPGPIDPGRTSPGALIVDLRYERAITPWVARARGAGREAYDGLGLLVFQACRSLAMWTDREVDVAPLARAVGWPR